MCLRMKLPPRSNRHPCSHSHTCIVTSEQSKATGWCPLWVRAGKTSPVPSFSKPSGPWLRRALRRSLLACGGRKPRGGRTEQLFLFPQCPALQGPPPRWRVCLKTWYWHRGWRGRRSSVLPSGATKCVYQLPSPKKQSTGPQTFPRRCSTTAPVPSERAASVGVLGVEGHFNPLDLMAQLDGGPQLQLHALLHRGQRQQEQRLPVDVLPGNRGM